jgi:hypothetical protein
VRVDVIRVGSREGAFTSIEPAPAHITIVSSKPGLAEWQSAEVLFHEVSHALAAPIITAFATELRAQGKGGGLGGRGQLGSRTADLWHVALFYMTGEVVRQALLDRGITYEPYLYKTGLFDRAWPQFRTPIETYWKAYVNGEMSRDESIRRIVTALQ